MTTSDEITSNMVLAFFMMSTHFYYNANIRLSVVDNP